MRCRKLGTELGDVPSHTHTHTLLYSYTFYARIRRYYITSNDKIFSKEIIKKECSGIWLLIVKLERCRNGDNEEWQKSIRSGRKV